MDKIRMDEDERTLAKVFDKLNKYGEMSKYNLHVNNIEAHTWSGDLPQVVIMSRECHFIVNKESFDKALEDYLDNEKNK